MDPAFLLVPQRLLGLLPPTAFGYREGIAERFPTATGGFDPVRAAVVAADLAVSGLLEPSRAARLQQFHAEDAAAPDFDRDRGGTRLGDMGDVRRRREASKGSLPGRCRTSS